MRSVTRSHTIPPLVAFIVLAAITAVALAWPRHAVVVGHSESRVTDTYNGTAYCLTGTFTAYSDGSTRVNLENCSGVTVRVPVYNRTDDTFASAYPIKQFDFAPGAHRDFTVTSERPRLVVMLSVDGRELPVSMSFAFVPTSAGAGATSA